MQQQDSGVLGSLKGQFDSQMAVHVLIGVVLILVVYHFVFHR